MGSEGWCWQLGHVSILHESSAQGLRWVFAGYTASLPSGDLQHIAGMVTGPRKVVYVANGSVALVTF